MGYVYLLLPQPDGSTIVRLIVDAARNVREAFSGRSPKDALAHLTFTKELPSLQEETSIALANMHLDEVKRVAERQSPPVEHKMLPPSVDAPPQPTPEPTPQPTAVPSDPTISAIFDRKPLPKGGASTHFPAGMPSNPDRIVWWAMLLFLPAAGIGMARNWPKLGKPGWMWPTLIAAIAIPVAIVGIAFTVFRQRATSPVIFVIVLLWGINWAFTFGLWYLQRGAYKTWEETGSAEKLFAHQYAFTNAGLIGVSITLAALILGAVTSSNPALYKALNPPQPTKVKAAPAIPDTPLTYTFDAPDITVTYPAMWQTIVPENMPTCGQPSSDCVFVLEDPTSSHTLLGLLRFEGETTLTPGQFESQAMDLLKSKKYFSDASLDKRDTMVISGVTAYRDYFRASDPPRFPDRIYGMTIFFGKGQTVYAILVESANETTFDNAQPNVQEFINGLQLK
jgi:hypothetical protein